MPTETWDSSRFKETLAGLDVARQRRIGARFIAQVLDLSGDARLRNVVDVLGHADVDPEALDVAYRTARGVFDETSPHSDLAELDFGRQARHFVAEACLACSAPIYPEAPRVHLAQKVAMYCRMARTCASIGHQEDKPDFAAAERAAKELVQAQYAALADLL